MAAVFSVTLLRHGQSTYNAARRFTGWSDPPLSSRGRAEAAAAGALLADRELDVVYCSVLTRAIQTSWLLLEASQREWVPLVKSWQLNERCYGALEGLNKEEMAEHYGVVQLREWRRSSTLRPPPLTLDDPRHPANDARYARLGVPASALPAAESLAEAGARVVPFWEGTIRPAVVAGQRCLVVAHGNALRALIKHLDGASDEEIAQIELPTATPLVYEFDAGMRPVHKFFIPRVDGSDGE